MFLTPNYPKKPLSLYGPDDVMSVTIIQIQITPYCKNIYVYTTLLNMITNNRYITLRKFMVTNQIPKVDLVFENGQK